MKKTVVLVTNIPPPYRVPVFNLLEKKLSVQGYNFVVLYLAKIEPNRQWIIKHIGHTHLFLPSRTFVLSNNFMHWNPTITRELKRINPAVVITSGFGFSMLLAFFWARKHAVRHVTFSDGTPHSERSIGAFRRLIRKVMLKNSNAFVGASKKTLALYRRYGANQIDCFQSCLCINNAIYEQNEADKFYDLLYVGQIIYRKMPDFIIKLMSLLGNDVSLQIIGDGVGRENFIKKLIAQKSNFNYVGFVQPTDIHNYFRKAKILLFPTRSDPWGIVANEACAAGLPVITTEAAGVAGELVVHGDNGYVLSPVPEIWAEHVRLLLEDKDIYATMSNNALRAVKPYNFHNASKGLFDAIMHAVKGS